MTNTKISEDAQKYGKCKSMRLIGWRYPRESGLQRLVEEKNLYPVNVLGSVDSGVLQKLSKAGIMLVRDLQGS